MEDYSYWNTQSPSVFDMHFKSGELPMLRPGMNHRAGYQEFGLSPTFDTFLPSSVQVSPEADPTLQSPGVYPIVNLDSKFSPSATISPLSDSTSQHGQSLVKCAIDAKSQKYKSQTLKGRMQNRDAQRRFRERKEELQQTLRQRATDLEAQCQELSKGFSQKSEEVSQILKEKEALTGEVQDLRKRWRLMLMLLQLPNSLQSLSSLLGNDLSSTSGSYPSSSSSPSTTNAGSLDMPLEELLGCLQELLFPSETPCSSSPLCSSS